MIRNIVFLVFCCAIVAGARASSELPGDPRYKAPDPDWAPSRVVFDCSGQDTLTVAPGFTLAISDSTIGSPADFDTYPCKEWNEDGPEDVYRLEVTDDLVLTAMLTREGDLDEGDLDLFLLNDCDTDSCLVGANLELNAELGPGTYFLVVDTWGDGVVEGLTYELELSARWPGVPPQPCDPGGATEVACGDSTFVSDLFGQPDLVRIYDCNPGISSGGEDWYMVTSPALRVMRLEVLAYSVGLDPVIWLFDGCGPDAVCLGFVNDTLALTGNNDNSGTEVLEWRQESELPATVWVAVDCALPPQAEGDGLYQVLIDCMTVPAEKTSFGGLRALYR